MTEPTQVYIWRNRWRGFVVVLAKSEDEARQLVQEKHPGWERVVRQEPSATLPARAGGVAVLPQRG
jgi:hypothetical protein